MVLYYREALRRVPSELGYLHMAVPAEYLEQSSSVPWTNKYWVMHLADAIGLQGGVRLRRVPS